jgi:hypothetical protein
VSEGSSGLISWGGDPRIVATRSEIDRASALIAMAQSRLLGEVQPFDFLVEPVQRIIFAAHLPELLFRLEKLKWACGAAGDAYLSTEARVANRVHWLSQMIAQHPWLEKILTQGNVQKAGVATLAGIVATQFFSGNVSKMMAREFVDVYPSLTGLTASSGDSSKAGAKALQKQLEPLGLLNAGQVRMIAEQAGPNYRPPQSVEGIAQRLQLVHRQNEATILIEQYKQGKEKLYVVYVPGTRDKTILPTGDPFDLSSGVALLADPDSASSHQAVLDAMKREGIDKTDKLLMVGYSQGGTIAADIATGDYKYKPIGLVTFGAPIAQFDLPDRLPVLSVEHTNDIVPALSGAVNPLTTNWLTVEREVPMELGESNLRAHGISEYVSTAGHIDSDATAGVQRIREKILGSFENYKFVESTKFEYSR